jgi:carboxyl-terminal processing protease
MEENKKYKIYRIIMLIIVTALITFLITTIGMYNYIKESVSGETTSSSGITSILSSSSSNLDTKLARLKALIDKYYLGDDVDEETLEEGAIQGYINALGDPYTEYITPDDMESYTTSILGNYVGIGIYMIANTESDRIQVLTPIEDSPAEKAGILPGDLIVKVDGTEYTASDMTLVSSIIKGEAGTTVKLEILRGTETLEFEIKRESINLNPVKAEVLDNNVGYIKVSSFDEGTATNFKEKFEEIKKKNITSLVIDLRNNGGGIVDEATKIADYIADLDSTLLITVDKNGNEEITKSTEEPIVNMPIVVLVNGNTASASEILTGALQDLKKATVVGTQTYGKGVIQKFMTLTDGSGIKITVQEYYTPNRRSINKVGIEPDEVVELPESVTNILNVDKAQDTQLQKALEILNK